MKIKELDSKVKFTDFDNFFNVYVDENNRYRFNLNSTVYFDGLVPKTKEIDHDAFWTTISYALYGTTRLWWLLMKINNVTVDNLFEPVKAGEQINYIEKEDVNNILMNVWEL